MAEYLLCLPSCQERTSAQPGRNVHGSFIQRSASAEGFYATAGDWHRTRTLSASSTVRAAIDGRAAALSPRLRRSTIGENTDICHSRGESGRAKITLPPLRQPPRCGCAMAYRGSVSLWIDHGICGRNGREL